MPAFSIATQRLDDRPAARPSVPAPASARAPPSSRARPRAGCAGPRPLAWLRTRFAGSARTSAAATSRSHERPAAGVEAVDHAPRPRQRLELRDASVDHAAARGARRAARGAPAAMRATASSASGAAAPSDLRSARGATLANGPRRRSNSRAMRDAPQFEPRDGTFARRVACDAPPLARPRRRSWSSRSARCGGARSDKPESPIRASARCFYLCCNLHYDPKKPEITDTNSSAGHAASRSATRVEVQKVTTRQVVFDAAGPPADHARLRARREGAAVRHLPEPPLRRPTIRGCKLKKVPARQVKRSRSGTIAPGMSSDQVLMARRLSAGAIARRRSTPRPGRTGDEPCATPSSSTSTATACRRAARDVGAHTPESN